MLLLLTFVPPLARHHPFKAISKQINSSLRKSNQRARYKHSICRCALDRFGLNCAKIADYCANIGQGRGGSCEVAGDAAYTITCVPIGVMTLNSLEANIGIRMQPWLAGSTGTAGLP